MTDTRTKAELLRDMALLEVENAQLQNDLEVRETELVMFKRDDGNFDYDLKVELSFNAAEQQYRVTVWEWRTQNWKRRDDEEWVHEWRQPMAWDDGPKFHTKTFAAKHKRRAIRCYANIERMAAERRAYNAKRTSAEAGWRVLA